MTDSSADSSRPTAPITQNLLGDSSSQAVDHPDLVENSRDEIPKAEETPAQVKQSKYLDDEVPAVGKEIEDGEKVDEDERPLDPGLSDLGWSEDPNIPIPLLHGLKNEDVWQLVRRFNKQTYHVKQIKEEEPQGGIDMNIADKDEFTPDKLRSTLERLYMTIFMSFAAFFKHIARIRSWQETRRTSTFLVFYLLVWFFNYLVAGLSALVILLLVSPRSRRILFPPAPLAAINAKTGKVQVPKAGSLGSDSITGAKESYKGQAVEQEATNLVGSVTHLAVSSAIGKGQTSASQAIAEEDDDSNDEEKEDVSKLKQTDGPLDPAKLAVSAKEAQDAAKGEANDQTSEAVDHAVWSSAQPILHTLEDIADTWERFCNALSPTPPFSQHGPRVKIASIVLPIFLASNLLSSTMVYRFTTFLLGFLFFAQPLLDHASIQDLIKLLDQKVPDWRRYLELRNSILKGVPTNAQLTITLLRIGEVNKSPLPPPPPSASAPDPSGKDGKEMAEDMPPEYEAEMREIGEKHAEHEERMEKEEDATPKKRSRFMALLKGTTKTGVQTTLGTNKVKATIGSEHSKQRLGVVKKELELEKEASSDGPASFTGRFHGKRGLVLISTTPTTPAVSFEREQPPHAKALMASAKAASKASEGEDGKAVQKLKEAAEKARPTPLFSILIDDIVGIKKLGGLGWKTKILVGFALEEREIADGLELETRTGEKFILTALPRRDEIFNRLVAMSGERQWEMW